MTIDMTKHHCSPENAQKMKDWIANRGGLAIWESQDLGDPGRSWTTPVLDEEGNPVGPPHWKCGGPGARQSRIITDMKDVEVITDKEVRRFPLHLSKHMQGMTIVLTDACSKKVRKALDQAGKGSTYVFDGDEVVILVPDKVVPLAEYQP
jgi:hypothetical protein